MHPRESYTRAGDGNRQVSISRTAKPGQRASGNTGASDGADEGGPLNSALGDTAGQPACSLTSPSLTHRSSENSADPSSTMLALLRRRPRTALEAVAGSAASHRATAAAAPTPAITGSARWQSRQRLTLQSRPTIERPAGCLERLHL